MSDLNGKIRALTPGSHPPSPSIANRLAVVWPVSCGRLISNSPSISTFGSQLPRPLFTFSLLRKALCVVGLDWDTPADAGLTAFDSRSRLAVVGCRADCNAGGVNKVVSMRFEA